MNVAPIMTHQDFQKSTVHYSHKPIRHGLHGVTNIYFSENGDIFWKNHFLEVLPDPEELDNYEYIQNIGMHCMHLESLGVPINRMTVYRCSDWFSDMKHNDPYKKLLSRCPHVWLGRDKILIVFERTAAEFSDAQWHYTLLPSSTSLDWLGHWSKHELKQRGYLYTSLTEHYVSDVKMFLEYYRVPTNLLDIMSKSFKEKAKI